MLTVVGVRHTKVTTFYPRRGRVSGRHEDALTRLFPLYGVRIPGPPIDFAQLFARILATPQTRPANEATLPA